jgi:hypothetical protein
MPAEADMELVTVSTYPSDLEASLAQAALKAFGIDCTVAHDDCGGQRPHLALTGGLRLIVRAEDAQRAAEVLNYRPEGA